MDSIIFDVDGTLWDSTETVAMSWTEVVRRETSLQTAFTKEDIQGQFGKVLPDIAAALFPELPRKQQLRLIEMCCAQEHKDLLTQPGKVYEGLEHTLQELNKRYRVFIVSNCESGYIETFLEATGYGHYFEGFLCAGDTGKPKGVNIRTIVEKYSLQDPVYVGDTLGDYQASKEAGVPFVHAAYGFGKVPAPEYKIDEVDQLLELF